MTRKIQHKRGLEANLPQLDEAEIAFTTDSKKPFIGSADGNVEIAKKADVDAKASKTELTNAVSPKADKTYVDTELSKKASTDEVSALSAQLADKASQSEVMAAVDPKADKVYVETELAKKPDKTYVDTKTQGASLAFKESYATLADLQTAYPTGDSFNHVVLSDGMIYTYINGAWTNTQIQANGTGIAESSITPEKTTFMVLTGEGKNKFNEDVVTIVRDKIPSGDTISGATGLASFVLPCEPNKAYTISRQVAGTRFRASYTEVGADQYVVGSTPIYNLTTNDTGTVITLPPNPNANYIFCIFWREVDQGTYTEEGMRSVGIQVEEGATATEYEPYQRKYRLKGEYLPSNTYTLFNNILSSRESETIELGDTAAVKMNVSKNTRGRIIPKVSIDGTTWKNISAKDQATGNVLESIYSAGSFFVDVAGWRYFKCEVVLLNYPGASVTASATLLTSTPAVYKKSIITAKSKRPETPKPDYLLKADANNAYYKVGRNPGELYSIIGTRVKKSTDDGATWSTLYDFGAGMTARVVEVLKDGTLLVATQGGKIWKSDKSETSFTEVYTLITPGANVSNNFGLFSYGNIILAAEYGSASPPDNARRAYISEDYGATFREIFEGLTTTTYHLHDICYDPYSGIIWLTNGDGEDASNLYYSLDMGETWVQVYEYGECPNQWTSIIALPNCVLFVTDNKNVGVWRWDRLATPIDETTELVIEPAFIIQNEYPGSEPIGTRAGVTYGDNAVAYFGFSFFAGNVYMPCKIWGTVDGYEFYEMWESETPPTSNTATNGILSISDPAHDGDIIATYYSGGYYMVRIENPNWS